MCELPRFLRACFARRCGTTHLNVLFERSLAAAARLDDPVRLAEAHSDLGFARYKAGRMAEAAAAYEAAGQGPARAGDAPAEAELAMRRGYLSWDAGRVEEPLGLFRLAQKLYEQAGRRAPHTRPRRRPGRCSGSGTARKRHSGPGRCWPSRTPMPPGRPV
ncbi:hypothetical protein [Streptomyces sp. NPDC046759]|uniref:hypothetical protein n=1 Tax=Streptomyces sp. NPDC046759 TaxID=3155019 RepID=UPI00340AC7B8